MNAAYFINGKKKEKEFELAGKKNENNFINN